MKRSLSIFLALGVLAFASPQDKLDALLLYKQGRTLADQGKTADAAAKYREAIAICDAELGEDATRIESYVVKCWSLFRLDRHQEVVSTGAKALAVTYDYRVLEQMGESYYFLGDYAQSLKYMQKYVDGMPEYGDRVASAYFYMGENFLRLKKFGHADIAFTMAVYREGNIARWWARLGQARELAGESTAAISAYEKAVSRDPNMQDAVASIERLKTAAVRSAP